MNSNEIKSLKTLANTELLKQTHTLVQEERRIGIDILHRLKEISRRRLHLQLGYSSVFTCLVQEFHYPEATAYRLLSAMKVISELPEVEEKIQSGKLSVSTISQVQSYCQAQKRENAWEIPSETKKQILQAVEGRSKRETEKVLASFHLELGGKPLVVERETVRVVAPQKTEIKVVINDELLAKLERIQDLTAPIGSIHPSYAELLDRMAEIVLDKIDPVRKAKRIEQKQNAAQHRASSEDGAAEKVLPPVEASPVQSMAPKSRYVPAAVRRQVWLKAEGQCCYVNSETGHRCTEKRGLELEHIVPFAKGGSHELSNLEYLCKQHNLYLAQVSFPEVMKRYVPSLK